MVKTGPEGTLEEGTVLRRNRRRLRIFVFQREGAIILACVLCTLLALRIDPSAAAWQAAEPAAMRGALAVLAPPLTSRSSKAGLVAQLEQVARRYDAAPANPKVDRIWRLVPGLNGVRLNVSRTLSGARAVAADTPLVFDQIPPEKGLEDFVAEPIYRGNPGKREMALTINVAWGTEYIPGLLHTLRSAGVRATFFLSGAWAKKHPQTAKEIVAAGMEIGNHAYTHPEMSRLSRSQMISQIERANQAVEAATGIRPSLFAPPSGDMSPMVVRVAAGLRMKTILWTLDTIDWKRPSPETILSRIVPRRTPGAIVLMHPTAPTAAALPEMIRALRRDGYRLVTVSQLIDPVRPVPRTLGEALRQG